MVAKITGMQGVAWLLVLTLFLLGCSAKTLEVNGKVKGDFPEKPIKERLSEIREGFFEGGYR